MYAVENCFHWIGFHIVNRLLEEGCRVDGIDDLSTEKKENLAMFVGRNELFRHLPVIQESSGYNAIITVDDQMVKMHREEPVTIQLPLLFGEWMPMNQDGVYNGDEFVPFAAKEFTSRAVYIDDFLTGFLQWLQASSLPSELNVKSVHDKSAEDARHEHFLLFGTSSP